MYGWLWRRLPLRTPWRVVILVLLAIGVAALLWYVVFPAVDRYLPANEVSVTSTAG